ncbi:MAG: hypothetical protein LBU80_01855 [Rikenellaceae bacterium]|jgi:hypothetical protein|nr:hypothetical protein [Rikenellaceae bacterium]
MIEQVIQDYLRNNRRLVLPEFGAFLKKEEGTVVFVPFLNKDDGILTGLVAQAYGATQAEARGIVAQYVAVMRGAIESDGFYIIADLGTLKSDANGILGIDTSYRLGASTVRPAAAPAVVPVPPRPAAVPITPKPGPAPTPAIELPVERPVKREPAPEGFAPLPVTPATTTAEPSRHPGRPVREEQHPVNAARDVELTPGQPQTASRPTPAPDPVQGHPQYPDRSAPPTAKPGRPARPDGKKPDAILIIAVVAAAIAIIAMLYGYFSESVPVFNFSGQTEQVQGTPVEQPAAPPRFR